MLNDAIAQRRKGVPIPTAGRRTVAQHLAHWLDTIRPPVVRPRTWQNYEALYRLHIDPAIGKTQIAKLDHETMQGFLNEKARSGLSPVTVRHIKVVLRQALGAAIKSNLISLNPVAFIKLPKKSRPKIVPLTAEQVAALLAAAEGTRLETLVLVAVRLALRRGKLLGLCWSDINFNDKTLTVARAIQRVKGQPLAPGPLKTEESRRNVPISDKVVVALHAHQIAQAKARLKAGSAWSDQGLVFPNTIGKPFEPRAIDSMFKRILKKAGIPDSTRFHDLRHTALTRLIEDGADLYQVSRLAGHSSIATTANLYGHWTPAMKHALADKMNRIAD
ncbi:MAG: tyrosine-type recombinase/integrase [Candidatus Binataceae bacterium]